MSQQKVMIALCLVASGLALASAQSVNPLNCLSQARDQISQTVAEVQEAINKAISDNVQTGQSSLQLEKVQEILSHIAEEISKLGLGSNGSYDTQTAMNGMNEIASSYLKLVGLFLMNPSLATQAVSNSQNLLQAVIKIQSDMSVGLMSKCITGSGR